MAINKSRTGELISEDEYRIGLLDSNSTSLLLLHKSKTRFAKDIVSKFPLLNEWMNLRVSLQANFLHDLKGIQSISIKQWFPNLLWLWSPVAMAPIALLFMGSAILNHVRSCVIQKVAPRTAFKKSLAADILQHPWNFSNGVMVYTLGTTSIRWETFHIPGLPFSHHIRMQISGVHVHIENIFGLGIIAFLLLWYATLKWIVPISPIFQPNHCTFKWTFLPPAFN